MMKLAFYKANSPSLRKQDKLIDWYTGGWGYSHCEIIFSDNVAFSASPREGCVRFKKLNFEDESKWVVIDLPDKDSAFEARARRKAESLVGKKYDWTGIFLHELLPFGIQDKNEWWCSEICLYILEEDDFRTDPNSAAKRFNVPQNKY